MITFFTFFQHLILISRRKARAQFLCVFFPVFFCYLHFVQHHITFNLVQQGKINHNLCVCGQRLIWFRFFVNCNLNFVHHVTFNLVQCRKGKHNLCVCVCVCVGRGLFLIRCIPPEWIYNLVRFIALFYWD